MHQEAWELHLALGEPFTASAHCFFCFRRGFVSVAMARAVAALCQLFVWVVLSDGKLPQKSAVGYGRHRRKREGSLQVES